MAQIFVSHSQKDTKILEFVNKAFASTNVEGKYEEIEVLAHGKRNSSQISDDIAASNAIFVLLSRKVEELRHTRDWVVWESGAARGNNKDVWVIEPFEECPQLSVVVPHLQHYVCFHYTEDWLLYLRNIIQSYNDSHVAKAALAGVSMGALTENPLIGFATGIGALILGETSNKNLRPLGIQNRCPTCASVHTVHVANRPFRCPVCNTRLILDLPMAAAQGAS